MKTILILLISIMFCSVSMAQNTFGIGGGGNGLKVVSDTSNVAKKDGKLYQYNDNMYFGTGTSLRHVPSIGGDNVLNVDSLAARALNLTGNLTISGTLNATGAVNTPELTINSVYKFGRATGTNGQILALATGSTPDSTYWTSYSPDASALWTRNTGAGYTYGANTPDNYGIGTNSPINKLHVYKASMAWNTPTVMRVYGSSQFYRNALVLGEINTLESFCRGYGGSTGDEYYLRLGVGGWINNVTGNTDSVYVINHVIDYLGLDFNRKTGYGFRFLGANATSPGTNRKAEQIFRLAHDTKYFYVGDTTSGDKDWRLYVGDDAAWTNYFGWDDGASSWELNGSLIVNSGDADADWLFKGDTDTKMMYGDASTNRVGFGTNLPASKISVNSTTGKCVELVYNDADGSAANKVELDVTSSGDLTVTPSGGDVNVAGYLSTAQTVNQSSVASVTASQTASTLQTGAAYTGTDATLATAYIATKITASAAHTMGDFQVRIKESANITNTTSYITGYIYADDGGTPSKPTGAALAMGQLIRFGNITTSYQLLSVGTIYTMTNGVSYWLVLKVSAPPTGGNLVFDSAVGANMGATSDDGSTWTNTTEQLYHIILGRTGRSISATNTNNYSGYFNNGSNYAVYGESYSNYGFYGYSYNQAGGYGYSPYHYGLSGGSSASYGGYFTSTTGTGLYASSAYILGECSVGSITDRCEVYEDSALVALAGIKKKPGAEKDKGFSALDHQSLPGGIYTVTKHQVWQDKKTHARQPVGWTPPDSTAGDYEQVEYTEEGRDLSKLVSMLVKAMQEQHAINKSQAAKIEALEKRVDKLEGK